MALTRCVVTNSFSALEILSTFITARPLTSYAYSLFHKTDVSIDEFTNLWSLSQRQQQPNGLYGSTVIYFIDTGQVIQVRPVYQAISMILHARAIVQL